MNYRRRSANWERVVRIVWGIFGVFFFFVGVTALVSDSGPLVLGGGLILVGVVTIAMAVFAKLEWLGGLG